jgi:UDP:flavonoid glycosyltransferase YjiC (YdhE family)
MKYLLIPENNSLSHIAKCLSIRELLLSNGHEVHIAVTKKHSPFLDRLGIGYHRLSDIQEADNGGFPSYKWFSNHEVIANCIEEEVALIDEIQPDRVLGVFRFTLNVSAQITRVPYDSLICGCMIPDSEEVLGFSENDAGIELQKRFLDNFFRFAGKKVSRVLAQYGLAPIDDLRYALKGQRTFLWDFPEFMPLPSRPGVTHVGPISLHHWPYDTVNLEPIYSSPRPIAVVSFGTCITDNTVVLRIVNLLLGLDYHVIVAAGGQNAMFDLKFTDPRVTVLKYAPLYRIFPYTSLLVTHGGQLTVFEALQNQIPVLVMPFQPEQAHNGVCLERIGCGSRLIPATHFTGMPEDFINAFNQVSDHALQTLIHNLVDNYETKGNLAKIQTVLQRYQGAKTLIQML